MQNQVVYDRTWRDVDLDAYVHNFLEIKEQVEKVV